MKERFSNLKPNQLVPIEKNKSKLIFEKCSFYFGEEIAMLIPFTFEFVNANGSRYNNKDNEIHIDEFINVMDPKSDKIIILNKAIYIPKESTIITISFQNTFNHKFDLELEMSIE